MNIEEVLKKALENMDEKYCQLSQLVNRKSSCIEKNKLQEKKIQERPVAYEFYHQFRRLIEDEEVEVNFDGSIIQAEVNKKYQHYFRNGKIPDFIIHTPDTDVNFAVIEFKLASSNITKIKDDLKKLSKFKRKLNYENTVEVIIGDTEQLNKLDENNDLFIGKELTLIFFNTDSWKAYQVTTKVA